MRHFIRTLSQGKFVKGSTIEDAYLLMSLELVIDTWILSRWRWILNECQKVKGEYMKFQNKIRSGECLPKEYDQALGALEVLLKTQMNARSKYLFAFLAQRPGFGDQWTFDRPFLGHIHMTRGNMPREEWFKTDPLNWCLEQLLGDPDMPVRLDHTMLFAFLDEHLSTSPKSERARLDQNIYDSYSNFAANHEMLVMVRLHRPLSLYRSLKETIAPKRQRALLHLDLSSRDLLVPLQAHNLLAASLKKFHTLQVPSGRVDYTFLKNSDSVRDALASFWNKVREAHKDALKKLKFAPEDI